MNTKKDTKGNTKRNKAAECQRVERWRKYIEAEISRGSLGGLRLPSCAVKALEAKEGRSVADLALEFLKETRGLAGGRDNFQTKMNREVDEFYDGEKGNARAIHEKGLAYSAVNMYLKSVSFAGRKAKASDWRRFVERYYKAGDGGIIEADARMFQAACGE